ncbi:circularly permuted type 2 ATP-grasp protein [Leeuwenhoekiella sp. A16]|uniref:circularly permuted type 2 ATP-grasp protein n=1 Tax=unclassified Leeuwenhoekiella TaxID=2615029 RepID=UPI003A812CDB|tara:strand:- start:3334 stop:5877 length:2544 start_codon:yes stop_codon:yes gene_type:complete
MSAITDKLFNNYFSDFSNYDEVFSSQMKVNPNWEMLLENLAEIGSDDLTARQADIDWLLSENGVTYNVYNDPKGLNRPWNLNIVPFLIHQKEWVDIEKGLQQRAEILNLVLKDIYGKRELIKNGIIPYEIVFAHRGFLRPCDQIQYKTAKNLLIHSADMARGPDGRMWVVNDRTEAPSGMGYALENRFTTSRVLPDIFKKINVRQPSDFFNDFNDLLVSSAQENKDNPGIVILTPGPHNETYFEHAYMSTFLGYPLVKGNDLLVRNGKVWLKSLKGLKQVDVILRRVDDIFTDPLELREDSYLGVAGLLEVIRKGNVSVVNPIGSGILENPGLIPFMKNISKYFLNEDLILPQVASWWCGQEKERNYVLNNLPLFVVKRIDRTNRESLYFCEFLSQKELDTLKREIKARPYKFVAQEKIYFSTTPDFTAGKLEPRKVVCRSFAVAKNDGYSVMPGGLVRVAPERENLRVSNQRGGTSKDFWIISDKEQTNIQNYSWNRTSSLPVSGIDDLPSNTAENLFWSGRYLGRTLVTARFLRMVLNQMANVQYNERKSKSESLEILFQSITHITSTFPGFVGKNREKVMENPLAEIRSVILDENRAGSLAHTIGMFNNAYYSIRNLWSKDMWRVFDSIQKLWKVFKEEKSFTIPRLTKLLDRIITRLIAFMGLIEESIMVQQGLLLYFIGLQLEQSMMNIERCRALIVINHRQQVEYEILESLLNSHESLNIYRYSYRSYLSMENVIELIILDKEYARSLTYRLKRLQKDIDRLPGVHNTDCKICIDEACKKIGELTREKAIALDQDEATRFELERSLSAISDLLHNVSLAITSTYFNHSYQPKQLVYQNFSS